MMTKEQMMDAVISRLGFENEWTIWFCQLAEILTESQLLNAFILLDAVEMAFPEDEEIDFDLECGFDPYEGCYTYDC